MTNRARALVIAGVLIVAACTVYAVLFAAATNARLAQLEQDRAARIRMTDTRYEQQQDELDELRAQLCALDPATCGD